MSSYWYAPNSCTLVSASFPVEDEPPTVRDPRPSFDDDEEIPVYVETGEFPATMT